MAKQTRTEARRQAKMGGGDYMAARRKKGSRVDGDLQKKLKIAFVVAGLGLFVLAIFDAVPLIGAKSTIQSRAEQAAAVAATEIRNLPFNSTSTADAAFYRANVTIDERNLGIEIIPESFLVGSDGSVTFTATEEVNSFLLKKYGPLADQFNLEVTVTSKGTTLK